MRISAAAPRASTRRGRCWISASAASSRRDFADIFYNNSFKNGILPIRLPRAICDALIDDAKLGGNARITVDLERQVVVRPNGEEIHFDIDPFRKHLLLNGLDDIGQTLQHERNDQPPRDAAARAACVAAIHRGLNGDLGCLPTRSC